ncbi:MAG: ABC transporter ATP-binding protein [Vicinamibacterales bacterium]
MSDTVIRVDHLGKRYRIRHQRPEPYTALRDVIADKVRGWWRGAADQPSVEDFWALKDVSFEIRRGEVVGVIGRNGAGKSTLLKILSRITEPTEGRVELDGNVASLLEVGTGFHPELSGRENVFLNGAILGMSRVEIKRKFDEIVAFAEIERFLDTPVKRYSSGMYVRLAFAVAAHLEPEILIVDEVLAVGDAQFQKKCLGKMDDVAKAGRTVLFVSHNMAAVASLCSRAVVLRGGRLELDDRPEVAIRSYLNDAGNTGRIALAGIPRKGTGLAKFTGFHIEDARGVITTSVQSGDDVRLVFDFECEPGTLGRPIDVGFGVHGTYDEVLFVLYASYIGKSLSVSSTRGRFVCNIRRFPLSPGTYSVYPRIEINAVEADFPQLPVGTIEVVDGDFFGSKQRTNARGAGPFLVDGDWNVES